MPFYKILFQTKPTDGADEAPAASTNAAPFVEAIHQARRNLRRRQEICQLISPGAVRQARRLQNWVRFPRMLERVYVRGYENLPLRSEPAPILALSHKKIHDVAAIVELIAGRPFERFHDITLIAQAGLFSAMYAYRDMIPLFCKRGLSGTLLRPAAIFLAHRAGDFLRRTFSDVNAFPVYREGRDIPTCEEDFRNPTFAGPRITGRSYADFVKFANRETRHSLIRVQQDMEDLNRMFFIMPEGGYRHSGAVAPLHDFLGVFAYRKQARTVFGSLSYDELCPDRLGRISAFINLHAPTPPPAAKNDVEIFLARGRRDLARNTVLLASHLFATIAYEYLENETSFRASDLGNRFEKECAALIAAAKFDSSGIVFDPGLEERSYREERLRRFIRHGLRRYFRRVGRGRFQISRKRLEGYARSERTVNDIEWNRNQARHFYETRDFQNPAE
ncbi:MAG: hypothetical protein RIF32_01135 [Leptospirales bacterium]|jgi:hypothetical protein